MLTPLALPTPDPGSAIQLAPQLVPLASASASAKATEARHG
jgi:hypothetical protein